MDQMTDLNELIDDFLAQRRIAVAGVSRTKKNEAANLIYRKLRHGGYEVFAVNPNADSIEGDVCYPDLASIPGGVEAVVLATHPKVTPVLVKQCSELGIGRVWMHRSFGPGSVSEDAVALCREKTIRLIPGGCPMMFCSPVDVPHRCMRWLLRLTGGLPKAA